MLNLYKHTFVLSTQMSAENLFLNLKGYLGSFLQNIEKVWSMISSEVSISFISADCWLNLINKLLFCSRGRWLQKNVFPWFCKNLWLISQSWADRRTTEAKTLAANCGPSTSYLRSSWVSPFRSQVHLPLNSCLTEVLGFMYVPPVLRKHFY